MSGWFNPDEGLWIYLPDNYVYKSGFACFDLDWTLVKPSRGKFPTSATDNVIMPKRIDILREIVAKGYNIVIFTNQKVTPRFTLQSKLDRINDVIKKFSEANIKLIIFMSTLENKYRKPNIGMWEYAMKLFHNQIQLTYAFYCGDAAGRPNDHSSDDINFSKSIGLKFYTPEQLFGE